MALTIKDLAFISIDPDKIYLGQKIKVSRGIRNKNNPKADEVIIFGCRRDKIPNEYMNLLKPYLNEYKIYWKNFNTGEEHYEKLLHSNSN